MTSRNASAPSLHLIADGSELSPILPACASSFMVVPSMTLLQAVFGQVAIRVLSSLSRIEGA